MTDSRKRDKAEVSDLGNCWHGWPLSGDCERCGVVVGEMPSLDPRRGTYVPAVVLDQCESELSIADSTAAGWSGPLEDDIRCQREKDHEGDHAYVAVWDDDLARQP